MKISFFDTHPFEKEAFEDVNRSHGLSIEYLEPKLGPSTAPLAKNSDVVCVFVNDKVNEATLNALSEGSVKLIALRSAGFNNVDLKAASKLGLKVVRVPEYSPYSVAEHVVALIQTLNRKTHRSFNRVREGNFSLNGLVGFDLHGKTIGICGVGRIGKVLAKIMSGFGCTILLYDKVRDPKLEAAGFSYCSKEDILKKSDIISLNLPLTKDTMHWIDAPALKQMKKGVMLINTGRGGLIDTKALIEGLKSGNLGAAGLDVYEEEEGIFFNDLSGQILNDDVLARLLTFPNVVITSHQAFLTHEALHNIAETTLMNISQFLKGEKLVNEVSI